MWSGVIVVDQPSGQLSGSPARGGVGAFVGPFSEQGLDQALSLSIGAGGVGPSSGVLHSELETQSGEEMGDVGGSVVGHNPADLDAVALEEDQRTAQEGRCGIGLFVGQDLDIGKTREVVDSDVDKLPTRTWASGRSIAMDTVTDSFDSAQLLDIEVDEVAGMLALVSEDRFFRVEISKSRKASALEDNGDRRSGHPKLPGDLWTRHSAPTELENQVRTVVGSLPRDPMRPGAAILESFRALLPEPPRPLVGCSLADSEREGLVRGPSPVFHQVDDMPSTIGTGSGITVDVHPGALLVSPVPKQRKTDRETPGGQLQLLNNLSGNHI